MGSIDAAGWSQALRAAAKGADQSAVLTLLGLGGAKVSELLPVEMMTSSVGPTRSQVSKPDPTALPAFVAGCNARHASRSNGIVSVSLINSSRGTDAGTTADVEFACRSEMVMSEMVACSRVPKILLALKSLRIC